MRLNKSTLETKLESNGWNFISNICNGEFHKKSNAEIREIFSEKIREQIREKYGKDLSFGIMVHSKAFDMYGEPIPNPGFKAVYYRVNPYFESTGEEVSVQDYSVQEGQEYEGNPNIAWAY